MRKFSTKLMLSLTLAFIAVGWANAKETLVYSVDYSTMANSDVPPFGTASSDNVPDGASVTVKDGWLVIENSTSEGNPWDLQPYIGRPFTTTENLGYKVNIEYNTTKTGGGGVWVAIGNGAERVTNYGAALEQCEPGQLKLFTWTTTIFPHSSDDNFVLFQSRQFVGTIKILRVEVYEITSDAPVVTPKTVGWEANCLTNADFSGSDWSSFRAKDWISDTENGNIQDPVIEDGAIKITNNQTRTPQLESDGITQKTDEWGNPLWNEDSWNTQFWIVMDNKIPVGTELEVRFKYKAKNAGRASTQAHAGPGGYIHWVCIGDVNFTTEWQQFITYVTTTNDFTDDFQSIAFNLNEDIDPNEYYFKEISVRQAITNNYVNFMVGSVGWSTFSCNNNVDLSSSYYHTAIKGYKAKYNGTSIVLTEVTQVPAGAAVIIEGAGDHYVEAIPSAAAITDNDLKVSDGSVTGDGSTIYVLSKKNGVVGFYRLKSGSTVPAGKAYLEITSGSPAPEFLEISGNATGINSIENGKLKVENGVFYNLAGQRVAQPTKGLYIVNGKKYVVK